MVGALMLVAGGGVLGSWGLWQLEVLRHAFRPTQAAVRRSWQRSRQTVGLVSGTVLALGILLLGRACGLSGTAWLQVCGLAAVVGLALGLVMPRWPQQVEARRIRAIRLALPAAIAQWRIEAQSRATLVTMLQRYVRVPRRERAALQVVVRHALALVADGATRVVIDERTGQTVREPLVMGAALVLAAERSGCQDLVAVVSILAEADRASGVVAAVEPLRRQGQLLERVISAELDQLVSRRALMLIAATAPAVIGALVLILFVASNGGQLGL